MRAHRRIGHAGISILAVVAISFFPQRLAAQDAEDGPWFGLRLPPGVGEVPAVVVGDRGPAPAVVPPGEEVHTEFEADEIFADLEEIVAFSTESRETRELGSGQLWGRVAGFPSNRKTVEWVAAEMRAAGIQRVEIQSFDQAEGSSMWLPLTWEARIIGSDAFGPGSRDVVLESAMPLTDIPDGRLEAPLVYVGNGSPAVARNIDVRGKIAVMQVIPQGHTVFERAAVTARGRDLFERGAVAVVNLLRQPGNEHARDMNCGGPCINLGGRDGYFVERLLEEAAMRGVAEEPRLAISLTSERRSGLRAENGVAVIPGRIADEYIVINAHADGWFDGAGDNGDGLAVMVALAKHFAKPENTPARSLVFVASAGHHTAGLNGPRNFVAMNPDIAAGTVFVINLEHIAQRNFSPSRHVAEDGYREFVADVGEAPIVAGVSNESPFINEVIAEGVRRYGTNFISQRSDAQTGEVGGFSGIEGAGRLHVIQAPPLYHTSGEGIGVISPEGLERVARFFGYFVKTVAEAPESRINPE